MGGLHTNKIAPQTPAAAVPSGAQPTAATLPWGAAAGHRRLVASMWALIAASWLVLWIWGRSGSAHLLDHDRLASAGLGAAGGLMAGWVLMTMAMMLPPTMPLVRSVHRTGGSRRGPMVPAMVAGYLAAWTLFGALVHAGDWALHAASGGVAWLGATGWAVGPVALVLAGLYQFTPLKQRCLARCCAAPTPAPQGWASDRNPGRSAFVLGVREGSWAVGCCWALMLLMLAAGMGSIPHMLALGAVMLAEQHVGRKHALTAPLGMTLVVLGVASLMLGGLAA